MKAINPNEIKDNFIELIGKEWMLVSAGDKEKFNMMTASWGGVGVLWNRPVVFAFIRPERYTREFIDAKNEFTITFLGPEHRKAHSICGSKSGREIDKVEATGLTPYFTAITKVESIVCSTTLANSKVPLVLASLTPPFISIT